MKYQNTKESHTQAEQATISSEHSTGMQFHTTDQGKQNKTESLKRLTHVILFMQTHKNNNKSFEKTLHLSIITKKQNKKTKQQNKKKKTDTKRDKLKYRQK